ncbi:MAG: M23 family metallopeptidase, partial [Acidobacteria bacterium]|nr:M23 family metallopeptidase [Acidobacteriota bacterium]
VKKGERVVASQLLAHIGNSGNTLGPHLHFQVSDAVDPLGGEGLPYALHGFKLLGRIPSLPGLLDGNAWLPTAAQPARAVTGETPLENMVVQLDTPVRRERNRAPTGAVADAALPRPS